VAFLDDDAVADVDWAKRLLDCYHKPEVIGAGCAVIPAWRTPGQAWFPG
jgi:GT2 family glycosyltransferase